jgi:hypothetical protein
MAGDERIGRVVIPLLLPTSRQLLFVVAFQQLVPIDRRCISDEMASASGMGGDL